MFHSLRRLPLRRGGHVGVGVQGEPGAVMAQHPGHRFHVYPILKGQCRERVPQIVEPDPSSALSSVPNQSAVLRSR